MLLDRPNQEKLHLPPTRLPQTFELRASVVMSGLSIGTPGVAKNATSGVQRLIKCTTLKFFLQPFFNSPVR